MRSEVIRESRFSPLDRARLWFRRKPTTQRLVRLLLGSTLLRFLSWHRMRVATRYDLWVARHDTLSSADIDAIRIHVAALPMPPLITVLLPVHNSSEAMLRSSINSIRRQLWPNWEVCICDDATAESHVRRALKEIAAEDPRVRWMRRNSSGGAAAAGNDALALARGDWVMVMDEGDLLPIHALYEIGLAVINNPMSQLIYSDEDKIDNRNTRSDPYFKADFDPELLLAQDMVGHAAVYRADLLRRIGGFRVGVEGSAQHDLALRAVATAGESTVYHIQCVLYHRRRSADAECTTSLQGVRDLLDKTGHSDARIEASTITSGGPRVLWPMPNPPPLVSVIVPTRDKADLLRPCLASLLDLTDYPSIEVLIADNGSEEPETLNLFEELRRDSRVRVLPMAGPFNYSRINNAAVAEARGEVVLLLNNDTEVIEPDWLTEMVSQALRPGVGAVGAKLLYEDDTVQHAGVLLGIGWPDGVAGHIYSGASRDSAGPFGLLSVVRSAPAVTAACLAVRRDTFLEVGGFDEENLAVAFNDVDFCLRLRLAGYRNIWSPFAELYHKESASRGLDLQGEKARRFQAEIDYMRRRWSNELDHDPFWNPNLSLNTLQRSLALWPRREKSWNKYLRRRPRLE